MSTSPFEFMSRVRLCEEITEDIKCAYPWEFDVRFLLRDEETGDSILATESYAASEPNIFDDVKKRWSYDYMYLNTQMVSIIRNSYLACNGDPQITN